MQAVIETGGKQYLVSPNERIVLEKLPGETGGSVVFDQVLMTIDGDNVKIGKPFISGTKVTGKVINQQRGEKLTVFKYRAKSRYRRKTGHRQSETVVQIETIV